MISSRLRRVEHTKLIQVEYKYSNVIQYADTSVNIIEIYELVTCLNSSVVIVDACIYIVSVKTDVESTNMNLPASTCDQCGVTFTRLDNMKRDKRTCTDRNSTAPVDAPTSAAAAAAVRPTGTL